VRFDLADLRLFLCVLEAGSITQGAVRANLALASASERLRNIEAGAGVALLERRPRGVCATEAGEALAHHARLILRQQALLRGELHDFATGARGTLHFYANTAAMTEFLPPRLASWLADRPGTLQVVWQGYDIETSVFRAVVLLAAAVASIVLLLAVFRAIWNSPAVIGHRIVRRRQKKGLEALSSGLIAVGAGDAALSTRYALQARKSLPHEPLTHLLRAQSAELTGDRATARRIYEAMLASPETEQLGLRGLFLEAEREGESEAARQFAGRALKANPKLGWSSNALFQQQCKQKDWDASLLTLDLAKKNGHVSKAAADRKRAVLLTAKALDAEDDASDKALTLALEAHALAPDLVPAAALAGRLLASRGNVGKAAKVLQKTWTTLR